MTQRYAGAGIRHDQRRPPGLGDAYFEPDERGLLELLAYGLEIARGVKFVDTEGRPTGTWERLFAQDPSAVLASIGAAGLPPVDVGVNEAEDTPGAWAELLKLQPDIQRELGPLLESDAAILDRIGTRAESQRAALDHMQSRARTLFQDSLDRNDHEPAAALFIAFLVVLGRAQARLNQFTRRHKNFYYRDLLRAQPLAAGSQTGYVCFSVAPGEQLRVAAQTQLHVGQDQAGGDVSFATVHDAIVSDAKLIDLGYLDVRHFALASPEHPLGFANAILSRSTLGSQRAAEHLVSVLHGDTAAHAAIGWSIYSEDLWLREGARHIRMEIALRADYDPQRSNELNARRLLGGSAQAIGETRLQREAARTLSIGTEGYSDLQGRILDDLHEPDAFFQTFGRIFARFLLGGPAWLPIPLRDHLLRCSARVLDATSQAYALQVVRELVEQTSDWSLLFYRFVRDTFKLEVSTAAGWQPVTAEVSLHPSDPDDTLSRLCFDLDLAEEFPALESGAADLPPGLRITLDNENELYGYTLFQSMMLEYVQLNTQVKGVGSLVAYNEQGPVDITKPFTPFGALPTLGSTFSFGSYEVASRHCDEINAEITWSHLPAEGFDNLYAQYPGEWHADDFEVELSTLSAGQWQSAGTQALFDVSDGKAVNLRTIELHPPDTPGAYEGALDDFVLDQTTRRGFFRLQLTGPERAFGHHLYHPLQADALVRSARRFAAKQAMPNEPWTPRIERLLLSFTTTRRIEIGKQDSESHFVHHHHPFAQHLARPRFEDLSVPSLVELPDGEHLYLGLRLQRSSELTVYFDISDAHVRTSDDVVGRMRWWLLGEHAWIPIDTNDVIFDSTQNFSRSGVITLRIADDLCIGSALMPGDCAWLRVVIGAGTDLLERLRDVRLHAVPVRSISGLLHRASRNCEPWLRIPKVTGISGVLSLSSSSSDEDEYLFDARVSERLRHKGRATSPWDYERLLLAKFPSVSLVRCIPNMDVASAAPHPGKVCVVALPARATDVDACLGLYFSRVELQKMQSYLQARATLGVDVVVANAGYDEIQVRCTVVFTPGAESSLTADLLQRELIDFLSPWRQSGLAAQFDWHITPAVVETFLVSREYVAHVTGVSLLRVASTPPDTWRLDDSVEASQEMIKALTPWSIAIPANQHYIEVAPVYVPVETETTGTDDLEIGRNLIIGGGRPHG